MVAETYFLVLMTVANLQIIRENLVNMRQTLFETEKVMEAGFTDPINVDQLSLGVANMQNSIANLERQRLLSLNLLKFQMGVDIEKEVVLSDTMEELFAGLTLEAGLVAEFDPQFHIDFRLLSTQAEFSKMVLRREQSFYLPSLDATFVRQEMAMRNEFNFFRSGSPWFPTTFFSLNLKIPIFSSGMRSARVQQARVELEKANLATEQVRQSLIMQMQKAQADYQTAVEQYQNQQENLELAKRIFERTSIMHREGLAGSLELTQASDQLLATQSNYLGSMFDVLNARNNLEKAAGRQNQ
jgi:outer membrane protein TolC